MAVEALLDRAGQLKRQLVEFSQQPRYDRAFREMLAQHGDDAEAWDEGRLMLLWDHFLLEYRLRNGRTVVEQFVDARSDLSRRTGSCCSAGGTWCRGSSRCSAGTGPR
jgi:hypothetical protein